MVSAPSTGTTAMGGGTGGNTSATASSRGSPAVNANFNPSTATNAKSSSAQVNSNGYHPPNPQIPLSSLLSAALDLNSVERRGQPTASRETVKRKDRPHGLTEAPTYYPTEEEWKDSFEYIRKITPEAKQYGICKIVPPDSWNPPFAIDTSKFHFRTRKQELNSVEGSKPPISSSFLSLPKQWTEAKEDGDGPGTRANLSYLDALAKFHKQQGNNLNRLPYVDKKPLDLYRLKKAVEARGGFDKVCKLKKWAEIGRDLGYSGKIMSSLSTSLKNSYQRWLCPYEEYLKKAKPGVQQQLEAEYGGPFTPSPAPSPMKRSNVNTPSSLRADSPARHASDALQATMNGHAKEGDRDTPAKDGSPPPPPPPAASGWTAVNSGGGGFKAVNAGFTSVNAPSQPDVKPVATARQNGSPFSSSKNTPEHRSHNIAAATSSLKRTLNSDSSDPVKKEDGMEKEDAEGDAGSRRSKRLKKDNVPTVAGSHMSVFRPSVPRIRRDSNPTAPGLRCERCGNGDEAGFLAACESCDHAYHGNCLDPPVKIKPDSEWNCPRCLVGDGQFGFEEGGLYSLKKFQEKAADFKQNYFENRMPFDPVLSCHRPVTEDDVEREFWRLVSSIEETVEVEYGADIHCTTHGSGFPTMEKNPDDPYATDSWNLNILPLHSESLYRYIKSDISGMTVPWVYVGMIFSTFCWHNEDHYSYSANYQHFGATKTWYGIPGEDALKFENAMKEAVPELFEKQPDLLFQLVTLLPPEQLKKAGVRVYAVDQRAGQFVITFPQAYHAGFNHGFNFNEAVNFAPCDWEPYGLEGVERLQQFRRQPCFSHDELLWTAAEGVSSSGLTIQTAKWLAPALDRVRAREMSQRQSFTTRHQDSYPHVCSLVNAADGTCGLLPRTTNEDVPDEECCVYCKAFTYFSRYKCQTSGKVMCLEHAGVYACCNAPEKERYGSSSHTLVFRRSEASIEAAYKKVAEKAHLPDAWEEKYENVLDEEATPSLKTLRNLLNEGERIPYDLPSLGMLRAFVDRCNHWVEEATNYTVRKQQNRRKNEKAWQSGARKSVGNSEQDEKEREMRNLSNIDRLLEEAEQIGFDCPEILQLQERADAIKQFQENAKQALSHASSQTIESVEELIDEGHGFNVDIPEVDRLMRLLNQLKWNKKAETSRTLILTISDVQELIKEGQNLNIPPYNDHLAHYMDQLATGVAWEKKAKELISAETVHYPQLEALSAQATANALPVSAETLAAVEQILHKQREAHRQIVDLNTRCKEDEHTKRPLYAEVVEVMKKIEDLQSKPAGTLDLEKEQKRHEDWMRKGKKLFGKTNAPLHILKSHMEYVLDRNLDCFDTVNDKPRVPAEPASREPSPSSKLHRWDNPELREVFCICRRVEAGMMIECELCHEWYHGKCLKIARGKVKEDDKYTCPICDWRVKIPRDAARPTLEALVNWYDEIPDLPFQPEEEEVLKKIIENAQDFRNSIAGYCNPIMATANEAETQRFYLRKIEGAEILLAYETNFFRQELHKWSPVAPQAPPLIEDSKSTRKPRPTKLQKLLLQYGVDDPDDLPEAVKGKANSLKRKAQHAEAVAAEAAAAARSTGISSVAVNPPAASPGVRGSGTSQSFLFSRSTSLQPQTPGLSIASSSHAHPSRGPDSASSSHTQSHLHGRSGSGSAPAMRPDPMDIDGGAGSAIAPSFFMGDGPSTGPQILVNPSDSLEDRLLHDNLDDTGLAEVDKNKALEIFSRTEEGRRRAEELYGRGVWDGNVEPTTTFAQTQQEENEEGDDRMFTELVNDDDDDGGAYPTKGLGGESSPDRDA